jgi:hypothetical protein
MSIVNNKDWVNLTKKFQPFVICFEGRRGSEDGGQQMLFQDHICEELCIELLHNQEIIDSSSDGW